MKVVSCTPEPFASRIGLDVLLAVTSMMIGATFRTLATGRVGIIAVGR